MGTPRPMRYGIIPTVQRTPWSYSCTHEIHLGGTATLTRYIYTYEVRLHPRGTLHVQHCSTATSTRYGTSTYVHLQGSAYIYEVQLNL
jgi:hypothetical protein